MFNPNHKWLKICLEMLVRTTLEKQLDPLGPTASRGKSIRLSCLWDMLMTQTIVTRTIQVKFSGSPHNLTAPVINELY